MSRSKPVRCAVFTAAAVASLVATSAVEAGAVTVVPRSVAFSGSNWAAKASTGPVGPGPNVFSDSPENVWVDGAGQLHLRITYRDGRWLSAEVVLDRSLGYGSYEFRVASPVGNLDRNVVLGLFTWSDDPADSHREIDIEFARWGDASAAQNAQYVVQPYDARGHLRRFAQPATAAPTTHGFTWAPGRVSFRSELANGKAISTWKYSGTDVPRPGDERTHINLWLDGGAPPANGAEVEVVLSGFTFTPR